MRALAVVATGPGVVEGARPAGVDAPAFHGPARPALDPLDLALVRGDAVFEALRVYAGRPFRLREHLDRLAISAAAVELPLPGGLEGLALRAAAQARGGDADIPASFEPDRRRGLRLVLLTTAADPLVRAASPWLLPGVKTISYATNMAAQRAARARGADDAVLVGLGGELLEAPTANLWWRTGQTLHTPTLH